MLARSTKRFNWQSVQYSFPLIGKNEATRPGPYGSSARFTPIAITRLSNRPKRTTGKPAAGY